MWRWLAIALAQASLFSSSMVIAQDQPNPPMLAVPVLPDNYPHPLRARVQPHAYDGHVEIPRWALDEGHNGFASVEVTVGPNGKAVSVEIIKSSNSQAIDDAAIDEAMTLPYDPATTPDGEPTSGTTSLRFQSAKYFTDEFEYDYSAYTCADMLGELRWYRSANPQTADLFGPRTKYTGLTIREKLRARSPLSKEERELSRQARVPMWDALVGACEASPQSLLTDLMQDREAFLEFYG
jgi:TonB family protein